MSEVPLYRRSSDKGHVVSTARTGWGGFMPSASSQWKREFFIDNLLGRIYLIIKTILLDRPCAVGV